MVNWPQNLADGGALHAVLRDGGRRRHAGQVPGHDRLPLRSVGRRCPAGSPTWLAWGLDGGGGGAELCCWKMDSRAPRAVAGHEDAGDAVAAIILHQHHAGQIHWGPGGVQTWDNWGA